MTSTDEHDLLWHYTSFGAFLKIMRSKTIWLSETTHLNDSGEMSFGLAAARKEIKRLAREAGHHDGAAVGNGEELAERYDREAIEAFDEPGRSDTFVASFSKQGDLLSQWRAYCPRGGVAIGFDRETLQKCFRLLGLPLSPGRAAIGGTLLECAYREPDPNRLNDSTSWDSALLQQCAIYVNNRNMNYPQHLRGDVLRFCPVFKHPGFAEEAEVRGIYTSKWGHLTNEIQVRATADRLVRYVEAGWKGTPVGDAVEISALRAIRLGPADTHERAAMMDAILRVVSPELTADDIHYSDTPLRRL